MPLRQAVLVRPQGPNAGYGASDGGVTQPWGTWIKAALDAGADGVIVPQVRTAADVETIVGDCRYPTGPREPPSLSCLILVGRFRQHQDHLLS
eukprot:COSAG04_NODE_11215_length_722_cov_1.768860_1_plen_93_part_00